MAIDVDGLDYLLEEGFDPHWLIGQSIIWHDDKPHEMRLTNGGIGIELSLRCQHVNEAEFSQEWGGSTPIPDCPCTMRVYTHSGLHSGAWCYAYDWDGKYLANLRDQSYYCEGECGKCRGEPK